MKTHKNPMAETAGPRLLRALCFTAFAISTTTGEMGVAGVQLNSSTFYSTLHAPDAGRYFLLIFSPNCGHCAAMMPAWSELEQRVRDKVHLAAVDAEAHKMIADRLDVHGFPTLLGVEKGRLHHYEGGRSADEMLAFITASDLSTAASTSRRLPCAPSAWDPLLELPDALVEVTATALHTSPLATLLLALALIMIGACGALALRQIDAPFIIVPCPEGVTTGQTFLVEYVYGRSLISPSGRKQQKAVTVPSGITPGQSFFVPLVPVQLAQPIPSATPASSKAKGE